MVESVCLFSCFGMVSFTPFVYIVTCEPLAETQTFRVLMDQLVLALTYLILLKCAHVRLPPICASWSEVTSEDLWDLHHVLALHMHGDGLAEEVSLAVRGAYNWDQLRQSGKVLSDVVSCGEKASAAASCPADSHSFLGEALGSASIALFSRWSCYSLVYAVHDCAARICAFKYAHASGRRNGLQC